MVDTKPVPPPNEVDFRGYGYGSTKASFLKAATVPSGRRGSVYDLLGVTPEGTVAPREGICPTEEGDFGLFQSTGEKDPIVGFADGEFNPDSTGIFFGSEHLVEAAKLAGVTLDNVGGEKTN
jgi:hypothetical protein